MKEKWWKKSVIYQIYPKSFKDSNGDGIGDLNGIIEKIDYLADLGIDVIWLCPINVSPMMDNGYDIADYYNVDPIFGTNEDFERLIACAKERGIKILMDLVVNHCSNQHKWFQEAVKNPESEYADYFLIEETSGKEPNNIRCYNGTSAWERIDESNRFYFHSFSKEQPDLNWANPNVRQEIIRMMKFWQKKGIAGFRIDAIGNIKKTKEALAQTILPTDGTDGMVSVDKYVLMQDGIEAYLAELRDEVFERYDMFTVAEVSVPEGKMEEFVGEHGFFSTVFDFSYTDMDVEKSNGKEWKKRFTIREMREKIFASQNMIEKYGWGSPYLENHDQPRSVNKYIPKESIGYESKTALGALYFFLRGTPFIYQGQELGMENYPFSDISQIRDPFAVQRYEQSVKNGENPQKDMEYFRARGRDNSRTPMQWDESIYAGFSEEEPWIAVNPDYETINAKTERQNDKSVYHFYKKMIALRKQSEYSDVLTYGDFSPIESDEDALIGYYRSNGEKRVAVLVNFGEGEAAIPKQLANGKRILDNQDRWNTERLLPYQAVLIAEGE